jgi:hypothetical protein
MTKVSERGRAASASPESDQLLLVDDIVGKDQSARAEQRGVALGAATAGPQFDVSWEAIDNRAKFSLCRLPCRRCREPQHQHLRFGRFHARENVACGEIGSEIDNPEAAGGGEKGRAKGAELMAVARGGCEEQACRHVPARVQPEERAEDVPDGRGHEVLLRNADMSSMPLVADLNEHRHEYLTQKFLGTEHSRQARDLVVDARRVVGA